MMDDGKRNNKTILPQNVCRRGEPPTIVILPLLVCMAVCGIDNMAYRKYIKFVRFSSLFFFWQISNNKSTGFESDAPDIFSAFFHNHILGRHSLDKHIGDWPVLKSDYICHYSDGNQNNHFYHWILLTTYANAIFLMFHVPIYVYEAWKRHLQRDTASVGKIFPNWNI